ncbi:hypothetical protein LJC49_06860 [Ruminococcaceae bacterium OttesenSCG-928-I18]|nr:hypothetical protein [Ruminococcaceae bacterium OttesenSCG-928-I18]
MEGTENARITIFAGHFGSGKTNLAINYALWLKERYEEVLLCDLDIVNPYFRTADARDKLQKKGVELISSRFANTNVDAPALPAETRQIFDRPDAVSVVDLGGDDRGALALGRYAKPLREGNEYEMLLVVNPYRPLTGTKDDLDEIVHEIEAASRIAFTGIVNNANLGPETTLGDIEDCLSFIRESSQRLKLPLKMTSIRRALLAEKGEELQRIHQMGEVFPIDLFEKSSWKL